MLNIKFPPVKKLGQNFLSDGNYLQKIIDNCPINNRTVIVEIGSGYGCLTNVLAKTNCSKIFSYEKDLRLFNWLLDNNENPDKITFINQDALCIDWINTYTKYLHRDNSLIVVGNLPYYIANSLIINLLFNYQLFNCLVFLIQKEVAQRWTGQKTQYSALSVFINYLAITKLICLVPASTFKPIPKVEGALVQIKFHNNQKFTIQELRKFWNFLRNCFHFRRKTLFKNLLSFSGEQRKKWEEYWINNNYLSTIRPHNLLPPEYWKLFTFWQKIYKEN